MQLDRIALLLGLTASAWAQERVITTVAGTDFTYPDGVLPALEAPLGRPFGLAFDTAGNLYFLDSENLRVLRLDTSARISVVAGNGISGTPGNQIQATRSPLVSLFALAVDRAGNIYFGGRAQVLKVDTNGVISRFAGSATGESGFRGDGGPATQALIGGLAQGLAVDAGGRVFIADSLNHRIRVVETDGTIRTVAGSGPTGFGQGGFSGDGGPATEARLDEPIDIAVDRQGNIYIPQFRQNRIRRVRRDGAIETVAGNGTTFAAPGASALQTGLPGLGSLTLDGQDNPVFQSSDRVLRLMPNGQLQTLFTLPASPIFSLGRLAISPAGDLYAGDVINRKILQLPFGGFPRAVAGSGVVRFGGDGGPALSAFLNSPGDVAADGNGNVFIADTDNFRIRRIGPDGAIRTVVGNGTSGIPGLTAPPTATPLRQVRNFAMDLTGRLYFDNQNEILRLNTDNTLTLIGGRGREDEEGIAAENVLATTVTMGVADGLAVAPDGTVYFPQSFFHRIRRIGPDGRISTIAGRLRVSGFEGDRGPSAAALLNSPQAMALDRAGNLFFYDGGNLRIRRINRGGAIETIMGTGQTGTIREGPAAQSPLPGGPVDLVVDAADNLLISAGGTVWLMTPQGQLQRLAGDPRAVSAGDGGSALAARLGLGGGIFADAAGNLYIAEPNNHRIRKVLVTPPAASASVGSLAFEARSGGPPARSQAFTVSASILGVAFGATVATASGGQWLTVSQPQGETPRIVEVTADPSTLAAGTYTGTIAVTTPLATPAERTIAVTFTVLPGLPALLAVDKTTLTFPYPRQAAARTESLVVSNAGGGTLAVSATAITSRGGAWLRVTPATATVTPRSPATLTVEADPQGLEVGTYRGTVQLAAGTDVVNVDVTMTVSARATAIRLSQTGLSFTGVAGGGIIPPQNFAVLNPGTGALPFAVRTSTLTGGDRWLRAEAEASVSRAGERPPLVTITTDQTGLAPGSYYGLVEVSSAEAANTPQVVTVNLQVLPPDAAPGSVVVPTELVLVFPAGSVPESSDLFLFNLNTTPLTVRYAGTDPLIQVLPRDAVVDPRRPLRLTVQSIQTLPATNPRTILRRTIPIAFSDGRLVEVALVFIGPEGGAGTTADGQRTANGCAPTRLIPSVLTLGQALRVPTGWPAGMVIDVKDDCGTAIDTGSVTASFSNGDASVSLVPVRQGRWHGTWIPRSAAGEVVVRVRADLPSPSLTGEREVRTDLRANQLAPTILKDAVVSVASPVAGAPVAAGGVVSVFGERLTEARIETAATLPLPSRLADVSLIIAGRRMPLFYSSEQQVNALVPPDIEPNTSHQILVQRGATYSDPAPVTVSAAAPALFTYGDRRAAVFVVRGDQQFLNATDAPARAGDTLVFYATGLGEVDAAVPAGSASPQSPAAQVRNRVVLRVGGIEVTPFFAGLTPGFVGLYQINANLPEGVGRGSDVEVTAEVLGLVSPPALLAVQ